MADLIIDGTTYSGSPTNTANPQRPLELTRTRRKIGRVLEAADGTTNYLHRGFKFTFTLKWPKANTVTQAAVFAIRAKTTSFAYVDFNAASYTVLNVSDDEYEEVVSTDKANNYKFDLTLILREV
jgi:chloramphenicol O-acetyltransferase